MSKLSPMMEQYFTIKNEYKQCLLFFRLGDFYEMFFDDALLASKELDLTLTGRDCGMEERAPMCGVPFHSADSYIARLVQKGYKVAICEQVEDPKQTKSIVKREVVRIVTSGTLMDTAYLDEGKNNYILAIYESKESFGLAICDVSTGEFLTTSMKTADEKSLTDEIAKFNPSEIIINKNFNYTYQLEGMFNLKTHTYNDWCFDHNNAYISLCNHFRVLNLYGYGLEDKREAVCASGALISYLTETQKNSLPHILSLKYYAHEQYMILDVSSRKNLEITENIREGNKKGSLLWVLDKTKTAMGARLMRKWLEQPLIDPDEINERLSSVEELKNSPILREELKEYLNTIYDIERLVSKLSYQSANGRDLVSLKNSLKNLPHIKEILASLKTALFTGMYQEFDLLDDVYNYIETSINDDPPFSIREGGFIRRGFNSELDTYFEAKEKGAGWLLEMENEERGKTGIKNLKIKYNKIFGYCYEVTNSYKDMAPDYFIRRQTLSNCERYTTEELKKIEDTIMGADEKICELEYKLFNEIRDVILKELGRIKCQAGLLAVLDCIQSFADAADNLRYVRPVVNNSGIIDIKEGRHPVIEVMSKQTFISNDTYLDMDENRLTILTGPNMAGKSTYMRQTAIIVLMAQVGSFVPADYAEIGVVDKIFTRVGASDDLATGQSTFMVEMSEVANILNNGTSNSLLILDEIGRGTSTYDGLSIAWAVMEYIADKKLLGARTLFATHYHELTELEGKVAGIKNYCITVDQVGDNIVFLRKIARGGARASYGIQVAKLAGVPDKVINRSNDILTALNSADITKNSQFEPKEIYYKPKKTDKNKNKLIINELAAIDVDNLTPIQALTALSTLKEMVKALL